MKTTISQDQFGGISFKNIGITIIYKGGVKEIFINADNIQTIVLDKGEKVVSIRLTSNEEIVLAITEFTRAYSDLLKGYQDLKLKFLPSDATKCQATSCRY
jgi:hypothetical protein